jgi:hypothetical protein
VGRAPLVTVADVVLPGLPGGTPRLRAVLAVPRGEGPWPGSAADAWRRIEAFVAEHLSARA